MKDSADSARTKLIDLCVVLDEHVKLLRDYATTPGNVWLARGELERISELSAEIDALLRAIKEAD